MAPSKTFFALQLVLISLLLLATKSGLSNAMTECTKECWLAASGGNLCDGLPNYSDFHACDQKCKDAADWDGNTISTMCPTLKELDQSSPATAQDTTDLTDRDDTPALEAAVPDQVDVTRPKDLPSVNWCGVPGSPCFATAATAIEERDVDVTRPTSLPSVGWCGVPGSPCFAAAASQDAELGERDGPTEADVTRPTDLPSVGWCGVPGSPCFAPATSQDANAQARGTTSPTTVPVAPTTLATFGVPDGLDPERMPLSVDGDDAATSPTLTCSISGARKTECIDASRLPSSGPPSSTSTSSGVESGAAHDWTTLLAALFAAIMLR